MSVQLVFDDEAFGAIAEKAVKKDIGARALRSIIEEFMLAANFNIAEIFNNLCIPFVYRTHGMPDLNNINFELFLNPKKIL